VPRGLVQLDPADVGRVDRLIAVLDEFAVDEALQLAADNGPFGKPKDQSRAHGRVDGEQLQPLAQHAVVPPPGLLQPAEMLVQVLLVERGSAVDPL